MPTALELFERHHRAVFRFVRRLTGSTAEAEDLTQEAFLHVLRSLPDYEERHSERAWIFRIARNLWLDRLRARRRAPSTEPLGDRVVPLASSPIPGIALDEALGRLEETERETFLLREVGGLGYAEISKITGGTEDAVRNRIHRARLALRRVLGGEEQAPREAGRYRGRMR